MVLFWSEWRPWKIHKIQLDESEQTKPAIRNGDAASFSYTTRPRKVVKNLLKADLAGLIFQN